jgi:hypothetical protein
MPNLAMAASFSLVCKNFQNIQLDLKSSSLTANTSAAKAYYQLKYVFKNNQLYQKYPASGNGSLEPIGKLVKKGFYNLQAEQEYYEFTDRDGDYNETYVFHKNGYSWSAFHTHGGNNDGGLFQRTNWYDCKTVN